MAARRHQFHQYRKISNMPINQAEAAKIATNDLSQRLNVPTSAIEVVSNQSAEYSNAALNAATSNEVSLEVMVNGWRITLAANGERYEYRADRKQVRLFNFRGGNYRVYP
jgi:hypothetical protein